MEEGRKKALAVAIKSIEKEFGAGAVQWKDKKPLEVEAMPTGSLALDRALGVGGFPRGRVIEILGWEASGKSTLAQIAVGHVQRSGGLCVYIDAEHALDPVYSRALGVNFDDLIISQPDYGEQGLRIAEEFVQSAAVDLIVVDSVAALVPKKEIEGDIGDIHVGLQARMMSQTLRILTPTVAKSRTTVIFINQLRHKIGVLYGSAETTPGGNALKFYSSVRIKVAMTQEKFEKGDDLCGRRIRCKVIKNKVAPPFTTAEFNLFFRQYDDIPPGIDKISDLASVAIALGIVRMKGGGHIEYEGENIAQGEKKFATLLRNDEELFAKIEGQVREGMQALRGGQLPTVEEEEAEPLVSIDEALVGADET